MGDYQRIINSIRTFKGLWIECGKYMLDQFSEFDPKTISSIVSREGQTRLRQHHSSVSRDIRRILSEYQRRANEQPSDDVLLRIAAEIRYSPIGLSRLLLAEKYATMDKRDLLEMVKNPNLIPDLMLAVNVHKCQMNDNLDGPIIDNIRRFVGEEYEVLVGL